MVFKDGLNASDTFNLMKCECSLIFLNPRPDSSEISKYYNDTYLPHVNQKKTLFNRAYSFIQKITFRWKFKVLQTHSGNFNNILDINKGNVAATLLKIQEKKTQKGNSYAIVKLTDLSSVFELFIFSDILDLNRNLLTEGNSLLITLQKNSPEDGNRFKRINVRKIVNLKDLLNKPFSEIDLNLRNLDKIKELSEILVENGDVKVNLKIKDNENLLTFKLKNKRKLDRKSVNLIRNMDISYDIL